MDLFHILAEEKIKMAIEDGEFERLPGLGKPLKLDNELAGVPEELRMAYKIMKNAGFSEEETALRREMMSIEDLIQNCDNDQEREALRRQLNEKMLRFNRMLSGRKVRTNSAAFRRYETKISSKFQK